MCPPLEEAAVGKLAPYSDEATKWGIRGLFLGQVGPQWVRSATSQIRGSEIAGVEYHGLIDVWEVLREWKAELGAFRVSGVLLRGRSLAALPEYGEVSIVGLRDVLFDSVPSLEKVASTVSRLECVRWNGECAFRWDFRPFERLEDLAIEEMSILSLFAPALVGLSRLRRLSLARTSGMSEEDLLRVVTGAPALRDVDMCFTCADDAVLTGILRISGIDRVILQGCRGIGREPTEAAEGASTVRVLDVGSTRISDEWMDCVMQFTRLEALNVGRTRISDRGIQRLASHPSLQYLQLYGCRGIGDPSMEALRGLKSLRGLNVAETSVSTAMRERMSEEYGWVVHG